MIQREEVDVVSGAANLGFASPEKQQARAFLRERFLRVVTGIVGKQAEFHLHENTRVSGEFRGCDVGFSEIFVRNLETPIGKVPEAILRGSDVIHLNIGDISVDQ
ncbi:PREDICTED: gem-associated protein 7-like [Dinoponera quadriceps]|uniref:Gem-associated protein 7-like n=1 Tax=Dinoponera quadriceps TaxID=609295 RepID=A0A6P3XU93_DINQU|nr:PREDICTED: gem-associated protein 7-like [Dinoponera quadriceps]